MTRNVIRCATFGQFVDLCCALTGRGHSFEANADELTVTMTGGF